MRTLRASRASTEHDAHALAEHVRARARSYFEDLPPGELRVDLASTRTGNRARILRLRVSAGPAVRDVVAKVLLPTPSRSDLTTARPRLGGEPNPEVDRLQYACMQAVHEHVASRADPRFGTVRPLDHLRERNAILMEAVDQPTLRALAHRSGLLPLRRRPLAPAFANVGAWLRVFHELPPPADVSRARTTLADVVAYLAATFDFLEERLGGKPGFARLRDALLARAEEVLPATLPVAVSHGDMAPRNVFVAPGHAVTVFDMVGKVEAPIYEDLAYFCVALRASTVRLASQGRSLPPERLRRYEEAALRGYFGEDRGQDARVRFYETLVLLDRWASYVARDGRPGRPASERLVGPLVHRQLARELRLVASLG